MSTVADIAGLSPEERLSLIGELWDSLSDSEARPTEAQLAELKNRLISFERDAADATGWDTLKAELRSRPR
jgi:putative addiction module component (TIGR02574 family)